MSGSTSPTGPTPFQQSYLLTRRRFLAGASVLGAALAVGVHDQGADAEPLAHGRSRPVARAGGDGVLVVITLTGGNDALNTVAPVEDSTYRQLRGPLALDPARTHDIGDGLALHPALARTKTLWDDGRLAIVHGVGFDGLDRSHFHCMDVWQAASTEDFRTGWIGRWLDLAGSGPLDAITIGERAPLLGRGEHRAAATLPVGPFTPPGSSTLHHLLAGLADDPGRPPLGALVAQSGADLFVVADAVGPVLAGLGSPEPTRGDTLAAQLGMVAALIDAGLPPRVYGVELGSFDTHASQAEAHQSLLGQLDAALGEFCDHVAGQPVTVMAYSEFGRRVTPNASGGTDHGTAGTVLLAGAVRAGHHGDPPDLHHLAAGDLATAIDFRSVCGGLLEGVLATPAADVLGPRAPAPLDLVP